MHFLEKHRVILRKMRNDIKSQDFGNMLDKLPTVEFLRKRKICKESKKNEQLLIEDEKNSKVQLANDEVEENMKRSITNQVRSFTHRTRNFVLEFRRIIVSNIYQAIS